MTTLNPISTIHVQQNADFPPDALDTSGAESFDADASAEQVSFVTLKTALLACVPLVALAAIGAAIVAVIMLGGRLALIGFAVAFLMIMFIGMPLMIASITDALEREPHH